MNRRHEPLEWPLQRSTAAPGRAKISCITRHVCELLTLSEETDWSRTAATTFVIQ